MLAAKKSNCAGERTRGHGRTDERHLLAAPATGMLFPGAAQVAQVVRYRGDLTGQRQSKEIVHVLTSLPTDWSVHGSVDPWRIGRMAAAALVLLRLIHDRIT